MYGCSGFYVVPDHHRDQTNRVLLTFLSLEEIDDPRPSPPHRCLRCLFKSLAVRQVTIASPRVRIPPLSNPGLWLGIQASVLR